jgi:uncharacterized SAM-binding protein YcdF (DUF218 family)
MQTGAFIRLTILNHLAEPFTLVLVLLLVGLVLGRTRRASRIGRVLVLAAAALLTLMAYGMPFNLVAQSLESQFQPLLNPSGLSGVRWIVVLGGGHGYDPRRPALSQVSAATLSRVTEAVRLHRVLPATRILFSGGTTFDAVPDADLSSATALELGVEPNAVTLSRKPRNTTEELACIRQIVGSEPFILVTSALHMPRAMLLARNYGLHPIPSTTDFRALPIPLPLSLFPRAGAPSLASASSHEILGIAWLRLREALNRPLVDPTPCSQAAVP